MKAIVLGALSFVLPALSAAADEQYDRSIDSAAASIVASRIGDIRGGFALDQRPVFVSAADAPDNVQFAAPLGEWRHGLAPASERRAVRRSSF